MSHIDEPARRVPLYGEYECRARRRAGGNCGSGGRRRDRAPDLVDRTLRLPRRHGYGGGRHEFLRPARQRPRRDPAGRARRRRRTAGPHREARRAQRAASHLRQDQGAGLRHRGIQMRGRRSPAGARRRSSCFMRSAAGRRHGRRSGSTRCWSRRNRAARRCADRSSSTARATATWLPWPARRSRSATTAAICSIRP